MSVLPTMHDNADVSVNLKFVSIDYLIHVTFDPVTFDGQHDLG